MLRMCRSEERGLAARGGHGGLESTLGDQRLVLAYAVAAVALGVIDRVVGPVDEGRRRHRPALDCGEADAVRAPATAWELVRLDHRAEALQSDAPVLVARDAEDDDEFLAAETVEQVAGTEGLAHEACEMDQDLVAVEVPEAIVDLLEMVDVGHRDETAVRRGWSVRQQGAHLGIEN